MMAADTLTDKMLQVTNQQLKINQNKNIFRTKKPLHFHEMTVEALFEIRGSIDSLTEVQLTTLIHHFRKQFLETFYQVNQYTHFSLESIQYIDKIYVTLLEELSHKALPLAEIEGRHYHRIRAFIKHIDPTSYRINDVENPTAQQFVCAEYSAAFLVELLQIDLAEIKEPILDIGCGHKAQLVHFLRKQKIEAYGIDRNTLGDNCQNVDWFAFDFGIDKWGLIIANLSFSNHFMYHHVHADDVANQYAQTYMKILDSLQSGGVWIYAPSLPFFEALLPPAQYLVQRVKIDDTYTKTSVTKRCKSIK